jgi:glycosyltransferase involved in cell wall biosynthesis
VPQPLPKALFATCDVVPSPTRHSAISQVTLQALTRHFQVDAITLKAPDLGHHEKTERLRMFRIPAAKGDYLAQVESFRRAMIRQLEGEEYQLVHVRSLLIGAAVAKRKTEFGAKLLVEVGHIDSIETPILHPQIGVNKATIDKILADEDLCLKEADAIITPNRVIRDLLVERGRRQQIHLVPDGVNIDAFDWLNVRPQQTPVILYVGSLTPWQGLVTLIESMEILLRDTVARLVIVHPGGDEHWQNPLKNLANNLGIQQKVEFRSALHEEIPEILCQADVCVAPYAKVGRNLTQGHFPLKVIEYMACKRPIVASRLTMIEEVLTDGTEALLFSPGNAEDLSQKIQTLLKERPLAQKLSDNAYRKARDTFNAAKTRRRYSEIYRALWEEAKEDFPKSGLDAPLDKDEDIHTSGTDAGQGSASKKKSQTIEVKQANGFRDDEATAIFQMDNFEEESAARASSSVVLNKPSSQNSAAATLPSTSPIVAFDDETQQKLEAIAPPLQPIKREGPPKILSGAYSITPKEASKPTASPSKSEATLPALKPKEESLTTKPKDTPIRLEIAQAKEKADAASLLARLREKNKEGS